MKTGKGTGTMAKRAGYAVLALCLLVLLTGSAFPAGESPGILSAVDDNRAGELSQRMGKAVTVPAFGCPDLAYTDTFKTKDLGYIYSTGFAESVNAVASGNSTYSPPEIPAGWKAAAVEWREYLEAYPEGEAGPSRQVAFTNREGRFDIEPLLSKDACAPALLYLASLDYRSRTGNKGVTPVFPRVVRSAVIDLGTQVVAKNRMAPAYAKRAATVMAKIAEAERMGAKDCQPGELAQTKAELNRARADAAGVRKDVQETDAAFAKAEKAADSLLTKRQFAMQKGFKCYPE
ncbi:MAG TPA: hypothetical protein VH866_08095 [Candidatus Deferrimicrobiaceae bacterium]|jgi:hypothetical protein